ncbi:MAG: response regulator [Candidatus Hydrothermarchaeales archaeon]
MSEESSILIIDDDKGMRETLTDILQVKGYKTESAKDGEAALDKLKEKSFNVALVDIKLPDISGTEVLKKLKEIQPDTIVIMITAFASLNTSIKALKEGAYGYIMKPLNMDELFATIGEGLEKQRLQKELKKYSEQLEEMVKARTEELQNAYEELKGLAIERARNIEVIQEQSRELKEAKDFLDNVIDSSADAIITTGLDGTITSFSRGAEELYKYKAKEVIGKPALSLYPKELREERRAGLDTLLKGETIRNMRTRIYNADGELVDISLSLSRLRDISGKAIGTVGVSKDISKEIEGEKRLTEAYERLVELDKMKDEFLSNISHELRTPITSIVTSLELLEEESLPGEREKLLEVSKRNVWRLDNLVGNLLEFSRLGTQKLQMQPLNASVLVRELIAEMENFAASNEVEVKSFLKEETMIMADKKFVGPIFGNLIGNAIKFNKRGGKVRVSAEEENSWIKFCVEDTGVGIPKEGLDKVFDRFYQIDASIRRRYPGTGLGLTIAKEMVERQGGMIWAESELGKGSRFYFTLPSEPRTRTRKKINEK